MKAALQRIQTGDMGARLIVGLDPGVETGWAIWDVKAQRLTDVQTLRIDEAMFAILAMWGVPRDLIRVVFEDARQRTWFGPRGTAAQERAKLQGVGSVKRDCAIWEEFLTAHGIPYVAQKPVAGATKWKADYFKKVTGWTARTSEHGRDAAVLVVGASK